MNLTVAFVISASIALPLQAGELIVLSKEGHEALNFSLISTSNPEGKAIRPFNGIDEQLDGKIHWKDVSPGDYCIVIDPDEEDWSAHWIGTRTVKVTDGSTQVDLVIPSGELEVEVQFAGVAEPKQETGVAQILRVERVQKDGKIDPLFRQWLWCTRENGRLKGDLSYLAPGNYRFTAFGVDEEIESKDAGFGSLMVDEALLKKGKATVSIDTKVEPAAPSSGDKPAK